LRARLLGALRVGRKERRPGGGRPVVRVESFASGPTASLDVQGTTRSGLQRFGREGGWVERLRRSSPASIVVSTADVFRDAKGAKSDLAAYGDQLARMRANGLANRVRPARIGDGAIGAELAFRKTQTTE
jgi:hypothetical protein